MKQALISIDKSCLIESSQIAQVEIDEKGKTRLLLFFKQASVRERVSAHIRRRLRFRQQVLVFSELLERNVKVFFGTVFLQCLESFQSSTSASYVAHDSFQNKYKGPFKYVCLL